MKCGVAIRVLCVDLVKAEQKLLIATYVPYMLGRRTGSRFNPTSQSQPLAKGKESDISCVLRECESWMNIPEALKLPSTGQPEGEE